MSPYRSRRDVHLLLEIQFTLSFCSRGIEKQSGNRAVFFSGFSAAVHVNLKDFSQIYKYVVTHTHNKLLILNTIVQILLSISPPQHYTEQLKLYLLLLSNPAEFNLLKNKTTTKKTGFKLMSLSLRAALITSFNPSLLCPFSCLQLYTEKMGALMHFSWVSHWLTHALLNWNEKM